MSHCNNEQDKLINKRSDALIANSETRAMLSEQCCNLNCLKKMPKY